MRERQPLRRKIMARAQGRPVATVVAIGCITVGFSGTLRAWQQPDVNANEPEGARVLTQGPIHEAFAEPIVFDPKPGPVVPKAPPKPIPEVPPDQKPEGANVQWIPGYWAWDDARNDFIWVSGVWRAIPPDREWIPGYWQQVDGGYQWVPGYWRSTEATQVEYLPEPPASVENGPSSPPPSPDATWAPGMWVSQDSQYVWRPGFWVNDQQGWMWTPASYSWTPNGYVYNPGYWDYPLANRGILFAPTYFSQPIYTAPNFVYTPAVSLLASALYSSLFVRPSYSSYYFGDYYAPSYFHSGIYPWYSFHGSRYGYDPLYAYTAAQNLRSNPRWADELHQVYRYRREHPEARPPRKFSETRTLAGRPAGGPGAGAGIAAASNLMLARPLSQLAAPRAGAVSQPGAAPAPRFETIDQARRQELARQAAELHQFGEVRRQREVEARGPAVSAARPALQRVELPRSPIVSAPRAAGRQAAAPAPAMPRHPEFDRAVRPAPGAAAPIRHEPRPEVRPPVPFAKPARLQVPGQPRPR
jgi:hypothetical protein